LFEVYEVTERLLINEAQQFGENTPISEYAHDRVRNLLQFTETQLGRLEMKREQEESFDRILNIRGSHLTHPMPTERTYETILSEIKALRKSVEYAMQRRKFLFMPPENAAYYEADDLFGIKDKFPKANEELILAGNCYAVGSYTACVFHLMRAVESGAKVMVYAMKAQKHLTVYSKSAGKTVRKPVELCDWGTLIGSLETALKELEKGTKTSIAKKQTLIYYSHAIAQFRQFKDAWRNNVSHSRKIYQAGETKDIMDNTKHFLQHLAQRIKE
jgi:hypothetical protein